MTHEEAREMLLDLAYGELEPAERAAVQQHVSGCAGCAAELESMARTRGAAGLLPDPGPPGGREELIEAARKAVTRPAPRRRSWARPAAWMATAAVVLAVGGVTLRWLDESPRREDGAGQVVAAAPAASEAPPARAVPEAAPKAVPKRPPPPPEVSAAPAPPAAPAGAVAGALASRERAAEAKAEEPAAAAKARPGTAGEKPAFPPGVTGAFASLDLRSGAWFRVNAGGCATRHSPFSTFKIPSSLIGLETGVVKEDQGLRTALAGSIVPYFREVATRVGELRMKRWLATFDYGNQDLSGGLDRFWLGSSLRISPDEQVTFLAKLERGQFPVARKNLDLVKEVLTQELDAGYRLVAKTGSSPDGEGWLVGWVESPAGACSFALHLKARSYEDMARIRPGLARDFLRQAGCIRADAPR